MIKLIETLLIKTITSSANFATLKIRSRQEIQSDGCSKTGIGDSSE
jgi:hypothetical protein